MMRMGRERRKTHMKRQKKAMIMAAILGAGLLSAWMWTGRSEISEENRKLYEEAVDMQKQVDTLGFEGFCLLDYPVAMYDGTTDYVFYEGEIQKRSPEVETFVGTAYPVEDHFEVIVPTLEQFDSLLSLAGGVEGMVTGSGYGPLEQKAIIWHEAFHAYQLTDFAVLGEKVLPEDMKGELEEKGGEKSEEEWIVTQVDEKKDVKSKIRQEMEILKKAVELIRTESPAIDELHKIILEYSERRRQRMEEMPKSARDAEIRCELTEGTAYYVESSVYQMMSGKQAYEERYLENIGAYEGGRGKYYRTGLAKCLILDTLYPGWKETFDFSRGLDAVIEQYLGGGSDEGQRNV